MQLARKRLPKPTFDVMEKAYLASKTCLHLCPVATPVDSGFSRDESAVRLCEALLVATNVVAQRSEITRSDTQLLGDFSFALYGRMCPHGVGFEADALSRFCAAEWGDPLKFTDGASAQARLRSKTGVIYFAGHQGRGSRTHIDLWNGSQCLGEAHWDASEILFWELHSAAGAGNGNTSGGGGGETPFAPEATAQPRPQPKKVTPPAEEPPETDEQKPALRLEYEAAVKALKDKVPVMRSQGMEDEAIARALHAERRELGVKYKGLTPPEKLAEIYARNLEKYGDKLGPTIEYLRDKGKTWEQIIDSATRPGGKDLKFGK